jgi:hypothetical protein
MNFFKQLFDQKIDSDIINNINIGMSISAGVCVIGLCTYWSLYICYKVKKLLRQEEDARRAEVNAFIDNFDELSLCDDANEIDLEKFYGNASDGQIDNFGKLSFYDDKEDDSENRNDSLGL